MRSVVVTFFCLVLFVSCAQTQNKEFRAPLPLKQKPAKGEAVAYFAEGCFWHTEIVFQSLEGVRDAVSGYAGGRTSNPNYDQVSGGNTGHAETVQVFYDPSVISYATLVAAFFASHDPSTLNRQGNDIGTEYRSIAFYRNESERKILELEIARLLKTKKYSKVVTEVIPFNKFYPAEGYHQEYISRNPQNRYVQNVSIPDFQKFRNEFKGKFRQ